MQILGHDIEDLADKQLHELAVHEPLFISLGSYCGPAHILRGCGWRKAAFPFDWIISFDIQSVIALLDRDFDQLLNEEYLKCNFGGALLHTQYHLEFLHDGYWQEDQYEANMQTFKPKFLRRIERFRQLSQYKGTVFFIRAGYPLSLDDPHRYFKCPENIEISETCALKLYHALERKFPNLDFRLIIINHHDEPTVYEEQRLLGKVVMIRGYAINDIFQFASYKMFFENLVLSDWHF